MSKRLLAMGLTVGLWAVGPLFAAGAPPGGTPSFTLYALSKGEPGKYKFNPLIFHMAFMERVVYELGILKLLAPQDLPNASHTIYQYLKRGGAVRMVVPNFRKGQPIEFTFQVKVLKGKTLFFCVSNYIAAEDRLLAKGEESGEVWAMAYEIVGSKLVDRHYLVPVDAETAKYNTAVANHYLQDPDVANDALIEGLLLKDLKDPATKSKSLTYVILTQYYLMAGDLTKARGALKGLKTCAAPPGGISLEDLTLLTEMETAATALDYAK